MSYAVISRSFIDKVSFTDRVIHASSVFSPSSILHPSMFQHRYVVQAAVKQQADRFTAQCTCLLLEAYFPCIEILSNPAIVRRRPFSEVSSVAGLFLSSRSTLVFFIPFLGTIFHGYKRMTWEWSFSIPLNSTHRPVPR